MIARKNSGFTLVELIITIAILAILGTIAFSSYGVYVKESRNTKRLADISNISKGIDLYRVNLETYPLPTNLRAVQYLGQTVWQEGIVSNDQYFSRVFTISGEALKDPLTQTPYTYSLSSNGVEYEIGTILEQGDNLAMIKGNYNGKILAQISGNNIQVIVSPSILTTTTSDSDLATIISGQKMVYDSFGNIPSSYRSTLTGAFPFTPSSSVLVYSGTIDNLSLNSSKRDVLIGLQDVFTGTVLAERQDYSFFLGLDVDDTTSLAYITQILHQTTGRRF